ncbi:MAG: hypothetical protein SAK29_01955 [Scytonema sp. PMC 1069.18]|nr:hypothetical protein [Scytonema sp. PMC 1069.18]MEC4879747.1 hypothetical protein [Scytonema sp. PMC 1070.18]
MCFQADRKTAKVLNADDNCAFVEVAGTIVEKRIDCYLPCKNQAKTHTISTVEPSMGDTEGQ